MTGQLELELSLSPGITAEPPRQLLPMDGLVDYYGPILERQKANRYLHNLLQQLPWTADEAFVYGKHYVTARKIAWFADQARPYSYSGVTREANRWTAPLLEIKEIIEKSSGANYNACLANLYMDGSQGMSWHSDAERELKKQGCIASVSLGAERRFDLRHTQTGEKRSVLLEHGSLLVMRGATQSHWQHQLPKSAKIKEPRVNLTFRQICTTKPEQRA